MSERRKLSSTPDWAVGCVLKIAAGLVRLRCRKCDEVLLTVAHDDSLWVLADVARDHRMFCRDDEEQGR